MSELSRCGSSISRSNTTHLAARIGKGLVRKKLSQVHRHASINSWFLASLVDHRTCIPVKQNLAHDTAGALWDNYGNLLQEPHISNCVPTLRPGMVFLMRGRRTRLGAHASSCYNLERHLSSTICLTCANEPPP
jgi:hypothetical protein